MRKLVLSLLFVITILGIRAQNQLLPIAREAFVFPHANPMGLHRMIVPTDRVVKLHDKFYFVYPYGKVHPQQNDFVMQISTLFEYDPKEGKAKSVYQNHNGIYNLSATTELLVFTSQGYQGYHSFSPADRKIYSGGQPSDNYKSSDYYHRNTIIYTFPGSKDALALSMKKGVFHEGVRRYDFSALHLENNYWKEIMAYPNVNKDNGPYQPFLLSYKPYLFNSNFFTIGSRYSPAQNTNTKSALGFPLHNIKINGAAINNPSKSLSFEQLQSKQRQIFSSVYNLDNNAAVFLYRPDENTGKLLLEAAIIEENDFMVYDTKVRISKTDTRIGMGTSGGKIYLIHKEFLGYLDPTTKIFTRLAVPLVNVEIINNSSLIFTNNFLFYTSGNDIYYTSKYQQTTETPKKITVSALTKFPDMITANFHPVKAVTTNKYLFYITTDNQLKAFNPETEKHVDIHLPSNTKIREVRMFYSAEDRVFVAGTTDQAAGNPQYEFWTISDKDIRE